MAKSNAERQAAYRERQREKRHSEGGSEGWRINTMVNIKTHYALKRLSKHYGVTRRKFLEDILTKLDQDIIDGLPSKEAREYIDLSMDDDEE